MKREDKFVSKAHTQDIQGNEPTPVSSSEYSNFIDPRLLEVEAPHSVFGNHKISSRFQNQSSRDSPDGSEDSTPESLEIQIMTPQNFAIKSYEQAELAVLEYCESESTPGFTISSGWSETFFPYQHLSFETGDEYQEPTNMVFDTCYRRELGTYGQC
ncbi:hypothetical protein N7478_001167 [Penicillium angulare]|uniref:uncharacterized protein n=1 Tax=Penicillium angulare TaxID=116970 RepID=UPI002540B065|nr:uncharacterized protein N7478_001167 [Penicillium angulare]KAJ5291916.1 hypothetical protein N7478_001167 [Penicillium angulare]